MPRWMNGGRARVLAWLAAAGLLAAAGCGTVKGVGEDLSGVSDSARAALFGGDPDGPPID